MDPPTLDLDADNSSGAGGNNYTTTFTEDGGPVEIADEDVSISDLNDTNMASATITLTNAADGAAESLSINGGTTALDGLGLTLDPASTPTNLIITGDRPLADYESAIELVQYNNTSDAPNTADRTITVRVNDGDDNSNTAVCTVSVTPTNDAPTVNLDANDSSGAGGNDYTTSFTEDGGPINIADDDVVITDPDDANMERVTITLTNAPDGAAESLSINGGAGALPGGLTRDPASTATNLIITGPATRADYETAIELVQYNNTSQSPNTADRTINVVINDGDDNSNTAICTVSVISVNDQPTTAPAPPTFTETYIEGDASVALTDIVVSDADSGEQITATLTLNDHAAAGLLTTSGSATYAGGVWTITDSVANVNAALAAVAFQPNTNYDQDTTISVDIRDGGEDGTTPITGTVTLDVTPVNDAPQAGPFAETGEEDSVFVIDGWNFIDIEGDGASHIGVTSLPANGTLFIDADGDNRVDAGEAARVFNPGDNTTWIAWADAVTNRNVKFAPDHDWNGTTALTYLVRDLPGDWGPTAAAAIGVAQVEEVEPPRPDNPIDANGASGAFDGTVGFPPRVAHMLEYLSDTGLIPTGQYAIVEGVNPTSATTEFAGLALEAFFGETPEGQEHAWENLSGFIEEWKAKSTAPEKWVGLEEFFEWLNGRQYDREPENIRLVFSWDLIQQLIELFDSLMPPIDSVSDPDAGIVANPDRFPDWFAGGKAIVFDPDKISLTDLFESTAAGTLVGGLNEPAAPRGQETARVYDLNDITLVEALAS